MANFIYLPTRGEVADTVLVNMDLVTAVYKRVVGSRLFFLDTEDHIDVAESQEQIYRQVSE